LGAFEITAEYTQHQSNERRRLRRVLARDACPGTNFKLILEPYSGPELSTKDLSDTKAKRKVTYA
jgi:hypothetical protein